MASYNTTGIDGLMLDLEDIAQIPEEVIMDILEAESVIVVAAHKKFIKTLGLVDSGKLEASIKSHKKRGKGGARYIVIYPEGKHHTYNRREVTKVYKASKHGRTYTVGGDKVDVPSNEVGFIHEFGAPRRGIMASQWMLKANESSADEASAAAFAVYDRWLKSKNL